MPSKLDPSLQRAFAPFEGPLLRLPFVKSARLRASKGGAPVVELRLTDGSKQRRLWKLQTSHLERDAAHHLRASLGDAHADWLVGAPYVGAPLGDALAAQAVQFIDLAGNCYLDLDGRFVARVQGRSAPKPPPRSKELRSAGYQVLFALLAAPDLVHASQRDFAAAAGTSRQPVSDLLARLVEERVLARRGRQHDWVTGRDGDLLDRWLAGYRSTLRPKLLVGRFRVAGAEPRALERTLEEQVSDVRLGGTAGAYRLVGHYRGPDTVVHAREPSPGVLKKLHAAPTRTARPGDLIWMRSFGTLSHLGESPRTAHPLLVYGELLADPDPRAGESARLVRERYLAWSL